MFIKGAPKPSASPGKSKSPAKAAATPPSGRKAKAPPTAPPTSEASPASKRGKIALAFYLWIRVSIQSERALVVSV